MLVEWKQFIAAKYVNLLVYAFIRKYFSGKAGVRIAINVI